MYLWKIQQFLDSSFLAVIILIHLESFSWKLFLCLLWKLSLKMNHYFPIYCVRRQPSCKKYLLLKFNFVLLMKSHLQSYPCPLQINSFWNLGFFLGITIILQIITGIFLGLHFTSDLNSAYSSVFFFIREINYGWCLRYLHSSGASFVFHFLFLHFGRAISYGSYFYNPNIWFSGILHFFFLMAIAFMGYVLPLLSLGL